jgi:hypothetical protein
MCLLSGIKWGSKITCTIQCSHRVVCDDLLFWDVTLYCWVNCTTWLSKLHSSWISWHHRPMHYIPLQQCNLSPKGPASYLWRSNFFNIKCLTIILQNKFFNILVAKEVTNIIINNKLQFSRSFGAVSTYFSLKMWMWVTFQDFYLTIKKTNRRQRDGFSINKYCKNKSENRRQTKLR